MLKRFNYIQNEQAHCSALIGNAVVRLDISCLFEKPYTGSHIHTRRQMKHERVHSIALLSHAHKGIEGGIAEVLIKVHEYSKTQLGFRNVTGAKTAIFPHITGCEGKKYSAIMDLKSVYTTVPRYTRVDVV